jgi:dTMP kinase
MDPKETLETLCEVMEELDKASRIMPVIVEGLKDRMALRSLGVNGQIVVLNDGNSILGTCENISKEWGAAIIFTDWDQKGGELAHALMDSLAVCGISYDTEYRATVSMLVKKDIKDVEGLPALFRRLRVLSGGGRGIL